MRGNGREGTATAGSLGSTIGSYLEGLFPSFPGPLQYKYFEGNSKIPPATSKAFDGLGTCARRDGATECARMS